MAYEKKPIPPLTDSSLMPGTGKHAGERMEDIPAEYYVYVYDNNLCNKQVREYIEDNLEVIKEQAKKNKSHEY